MIFQVFGSINNPIAPKYGGLSNTGTGLVSLTNNLLGLITTIGGIFALVNFVIAGYLYLGSNNEPQKIMAAGNKILQTFIGVGIIALAYIIAAILGQVLYNNVNMLLQPNLFIL